MELKIPSIDESRFRGEWVALNPKTYEIISHNPSLKIARETARQKGVADPLMHSVPQSDAYFVGGSSVA